ncbi:MAG: hypothetical protein FJX25_05910 [Alphaproteobacteria bacterium]|nr:hypothetical protein [Alphaproteobacteria bacterium]
MMHAPELTPTPEGTRIALPDVTALLIAHDDGWEVGQFCPTGCLLRSELEMRIKAALPDFTWRPAA